jgi:hypothetical protein
MCLGTDSASNPLAYYYYYYYYYCIVVQTFYFELHFLSRYIYIYIYIILSGSRRCERTEAPAGVCNRSLDSSCLPDVRKN